MDPHHSTIDLSDVARQVEAQVRAQYPHLRGEAFITAIHLGMQRRVVGMVLEMVDALAPTSEERVRLRELALRRLESRFGMAPGDLENLLS
jgi:hypothetical protein